MTFEIEHEVTPEGLLCYRIKGSTTEESMLALADRIRDDAAATGSTRALLDCSDMVAAVDIPALYEIGKYFAKTLTAVRLAAINTPSHWRDNRFSENVIMNRGGRLMHFPSREAAVKWLLDS